MDANQLPGMREMDEATDNLSRARYNYDKASDHGYPVREAAEMATAEKAYTAAKALHPVAAAYLLARAWTQSSNYLKRAAGRRAAQRILAGEDHAVVMREMEAEWSEAASKAVYND